MKERVVMVWSGGKDSAMALDALRREGREVRALLTTMTGDYDRVSMHGVRRALLESQAASLGLELRRATITKGAGNAEYEAAMGAALAELRAEGVGTAAFGDIFLEDLRAYREKKLAEAGMSCLFPLWKRDTGELIRAFVAQGFKAVLVCVDTRVLDGSFAGREIDRGFLESLPAGVDPCGENGEFHSFVYDGPGFREPVRFARGESVVRDGHFRFHDLMPC